MTIHNKESEATLAHRKQAASRLSVEGRKYFDMIEFDANEELVTEIRKHPFGLLLVVLTGSLIMLALSVLAGLVVGFDIEGTLGIADTGSVKPLLILIDFVLILFVAAATLVAAYLYRGNVIYVTSEKIAQVHHLSLFHRKISQLSIGDVQDVTVTQKGLLAHAMNYGTLVVETAGEQQNYTFTFVPDPYVMSKSIVGSHEANLALHGN